MDRRSAGKRHSNAPTDKNSGKIQSICNGKCAPITMQGFARVKKIRRRSNNGMQEKKQCAEQSKQSREPSAKMKNAREDRRARRHETRISTSQNQCARASAEISSLSPAR